MINSAKVRADFPILHQQIKHHPLVYLDNSATTQKPMSVITAITEYYSHDNANVHRGVYELSARATAQYEAVRTEVKQFINAKYEHEIIFVRGTTEAINLVAQTYGKAHIKAGDEILISYMEHHSNIVPWQILAEQTGAKLRVIPISDTGEIDWNAFQSLLTTRTKILSISHASNVLGTINPIKRMIALAHAANVPVLIDGAQAIAHLPVDVIDLDCDFYTFSGHKIYGPTGIGVLYGKTALLEKMPPYQGGGDMIETVSFEKTTYNKLPAKFEAGTPHISGVIGLGKALDYVKQIGMPAIMQHEAELLAYATEQLLKVPELRIIGNAPEKVGVISFILDSIHPHDIATILDDRGIAIRAGHHCAMPLMGRYQVPATARASFAIYNTKQEVDALVAGLYEVIKVFHK